MNKNGVSIINKPQFLMKWNRTFRIDKKSFIQNGYTYEPIFLESFPEVKEMLQKWANSNLDQVSCKNVQFQIKNHIPKVYKTYLKDCHSGDNPLSHEDFLHLFGLRKIYLTTV